MSVRVFKRARLENTITPDAPPATHHGQYANAQERNDSKTDGERRELEVYRGSEREATGTDAVEEGIQ